MKKILVLSTLILSIIVFSSCNNESDASSSSSSPSDLYKAAVGRLYHTKKEEFKSDLDVCDLSLFYYEAERNLELTVSNCKERLSMVDLLMADESTLDEDFSVIYPHIGFEFGEDFVVLVPNGEEGLHELKLDMEVGNDIPTVRVLLSYFEDTDGFQKRIEHYLRFPAETIETR